LAFVGYLATYINGLRLAQRQDRLSRQHCQTRDLPSRLPSTRPPGERAAARPAMSSGP
jgi:hypothetical protein